jgi:aldehyde:ferredoxin oxidoreductase
MTTYNKGKIVHVHLGMDGIDRVERYEYSNKFLGNYLGGRGFNTAFMFRFRNDIPQSAYDPDNLIFISSGLLSGTPFPSTGRTTVSVLKSPVTGFFGDGNLGGYFGPALRLAGIDCLIISGKANIPKYMHISPTGVPSTYDARKIWHYGTGATEVFIQDAHRNMGAGNLSSLKVLSIGMAGAQQCFSSIVICENRAAGGGGTGAVFGSKNLKAIAVRYPRKAVDKTADDPEQLQKIAEQAEEKIRAHPVFNTFKKYGTTSLVEIHSAIKYFPTKNFTQRTWKKWKNISGQELLKQWIAEDPKFEEGLEKLAEDEKLGCRNCPIVCSNPLKIEYETLNCLGSKIGIDELDKITTLNMVYMNDGGLDVIQTTSILSALMEMWAKGISDYKFEWGDYNHIQRFLSEFLSTKDLIYLNPADRKFGDKLFEPAKYCSTIAPFFRKGFCQGMTAAIDAGAIKINEKKLKLLYTGPINALYKDDITPVIPQVLHELFWVSVKGMTLSGVYPSEKNKGVALAVATSSRGADHLRSLPTLATYADWYMGTKKGFKRLLQVLGMPIRSLFMMKDEAKLLVGNLYKTYEDTFGVPHSIVNEWEESGFLLNKGQNKGWGSMIKFTQEMYAISDAVSICRFTSPWRFGIGPGFLVRAIAALTGLIYNVDALMEVGNRIYTLERELLHHYNQAPLDNLSKRFFAGRGALTEQDFNELKADYYERCRYDVHGRPTRKLLHKLAAYSYGKEEDEIYEAVIRTRSRSGSGRDKVYLPS